MALAVVERAGDERHAARVVEPEPAHLLVRRRRHLQVAPDTQPAEPSALFGFVSPLRETIGRLDRLVEHGGKNPPLRRPPRGPPPPAPLPPPVGAPSSPAPLPAPPP